MLVLQKTVIQGKNLFLLFAAVAELRRNGWEESLFITPSIQGCTQTTISPRYWELSREKELWCEAPLPWADTEPSFSDFKSLSTIISRLNSTQPSLKEEIMFLITLKATVQDCGLEIPGQSRAFSSRDFGSLSSRK